MKTTWDFVEKYYPNYYGSAEIARNNDLQKIVDREINGDAAILFEVLKDEVKEHYQDLGVSVEGAYLEDEARIKAQIELTESNEAIFKKAIEGYIETVKN